MELPKLYSFVLMVIAVGFLLGIGITSLGSLGTASKTTGYVTNESMTITNGQGTTTNDELLSVTFVGNATFSTNTAGVDIGNNIADVEVNWTAKNGLIQLHTSNFTGTVYNISYTYKVDSATTTATDNTNTELGVIASTWIGLIITIIVLAIIIALVIRSFSMKPR